MKEFKTKKESIEYALRNEDFSDLTVAQIADVFSTHTSYIYDIMRKIEKETGKKVPYNRQVKYCNESQGRDGMKTIKSLLLEIKDETSNMTIDEIAERINREVISVRTVINKLKKKGIIIEYKKLR